MFNNVILTDWCFVRFNIWCEMLMSNLSFRQIGLFAKLINIGTVIQFVFVFHASAQNRQRRHVVFKSSVRPSSFPASCCPSVNPYFTWCKISLHVMDGFQWNLTCIFIMWLGIGVKVFKVRGQVHDPTNKNLQWQRHSFWWCGVKAYFLLTSHVVCFSDLMCSGVLLLTYFCGKHMCVYCMEKPTFLVGIFTSAALYYLNQCLMHSVKQMPDIVNFVLFCTYLHYKCCIYDNDDDEE